MLVLSRKSDESIFIGADVRLRVLRVRGNRVWIAVDAPRHVRLRRDDATKSRVPAHQNSAAQPAR